jgi:hypothetical protein
MKEIYSKPVVEVEKFAEVEVLTLSDGSGTEMGGGLDD